MIPARKQPWFNFVVRRWLARSLRRRFHAVYVAGAEHLAGLDPARPVVGCVNHTNWWDGFVLYVLAHRLFPHRDDYLAMEERNLRRYFFFSWMGCFGVDLDAPGRALAGTRYAARLLRADPRRWVWLFVQGRLAPPHRPVAAKPGARFLAGLTRAQLVPLALRYEWLEESRPSVFAAFGPPREASKAEDGPDEALAGELTRLLDGIGANLDPLDLTPYRPLFPPGWSVHRRWDAVLRAVRLTR